MANFSLRKVSLETSLPIRGIDIQLTFVFDNKPDPYKWNPFKRPAEPLPKPNNDLDYDKA